MNHYRRTVTAPPPLVGEHDLLTTEEAAQRLGIVPATVRLWCRRGQLEYIALPRRGEGKRRDYRIPAHSLQQALALQQERNERPR